MVLLDWIKSAWQGGQKLWQVFWLGLLSIYAVVFISGTLLAPLPYSPLVYSVWYASCFAMSIWWWVSVWRCAPNTSLAFWKYLARIFVVFQAVNLALALYLVTFFLPEAAVVTYEGYQTIR